MCLAQPHLWVLIAVSADLRYRRSSSPIYTDSPQLRAGEGERFDMDAEEWLAFANRTSLHAARAKARAMGINITWDSEISKTPKGYRRRPRDGGSLRGKPVAGHDPGGAHGRGA
jgi:hypothetical protein